MISARTGFAAGYFGQAFSLWKTVDGGSTWCRYRVPGAPARQSVQAPVVNVQSPQSVWVAWAGKKTLTVLHSTDGGRQWLTYTRPVPPVVVTVQQIVWVSAADGWIQALSEGVMIQGDTSIFHTSNGGRSWTMVSSASGYVPNPVGTPDALPEIDEPMPMAFSTAEGGWAAVGQFVVTHPTRATLYRTTDAGRHWFPLILTVPAPYQHANDATQGEMAWAAGTSGTVVFEYQGRNGLGLVSYHTTNAAESWAAGRPLPLGSNVWPISISFVTPNTGWVTGPQGHPFARTTNAGQSWTTVAPGHTLSAWVHKGYTVQQLDMTTSHAGWLLLTRSRPNGATIHRILKTTDGGHHWAECVIRG